MKEINFANMPQCLRERDQWVLWRYTDRKGKATKVPFQSNGQPAKSNDQSTWGPFEEIKTYYSPTKDAGVGFVFSKDDPFTGVDLDGCRDPNSGVIAQWAKDIILEFSSYAEVSPSETGVKIFCRGRSPLGSGKKILLPDVEKVGDREAAIEIYDQGRYFALTGWVLQGQKEVVYAQTELQLLANKYFLAKKDDSGFDFNSSVDVVERASRYVAKMPPAIQGSGGDNWTFHVACVLVLGFELGFHDAWSVISEFNQRCIPPWNDKPLARKLHEAEKQAGPRGYLKDAEPSNWQNVKIPKYTQPKEEKKKPEPTIITLADAAQNYLELVKQGEVPLVSTSISDLDQAIGGGLAYGEMVIFAARPSHGKSAVALQCVHNWTLTDPSAVISEEMAAIMLGKRTIQSITPLHKSFWKDKFHLIQGDLDSYRKKHKDCFLFESCRTAEVAAERIEKMVEKEGIKTAVIDYAQLLGSPGRSRYEQVTNTSVIIRQLASRTKIVLLALCQLNRDVESRSREFLPLMSDLKESGQLEQDADVVVFLCWPYKLDQSNPMERYQFFVGKNRNREINKFAVECRFIPDRQMFEEAIPSDLDAIGRRN